MAKCRIGHFVEAQLLEAIEIDYIDESEVLSPADDVYHIDKTKFKVKAFPEDKEMLKTVLCKLADAGMVELVLTTGAVGFLEKHCAPDAVRETADRLLPGIPEALRAYNLRHTKKVILDHTDIMGVRP